MAWVRKLDDGRYKGGYRDAGGQEHTKTHQTRKVVQSWIDTNTAALERGDWVAPDRGKVTVGEWGERWLASRVNLKPKTMYDYQSLWASQVKAPWERVRLDAVTHSDVVDWVARVNKKVGPSRTRAAYHLFGRMMKDAVIDRRLALNPASDVALPTMRPPDNRFLTHAQLEKIAKGCGRYELLVNILGFTGLRWGEATALRVCNVDLLRGRFDIRENVVEVGGRQVPGTPKNHERRSVPVLKSLRKELEDACEGKGSYDLVFPAKRGGWLRNNVFRRNHFDAAVTAAELEFASFSPHDLRDCAASFAIASGANVKAVQLMLGHKSATLTLDRYASLFGDELDDVAEAMDTARENAKISRSGRGLKLVPPDHNARAVASDLRSHPPSPRSSGDRASVS